MNEVEYPLGVMMGFVLQDGVTPLVAASHNGHLVIVKSLIEAGAIVNHTIKVVKISTIIEGPTFSHMGFSSVQ